MVPLMSWWILHYTWCKRLTQIWIVKTIKVSINTLWIRCMYKSCKLYLSTCLMHLASPMKKYNSLTSEPGYGELISCQLALNKSNTSSEVYSIIPNHNVWKDWQQKTNVMQKLMFSSFAKSYFPSGRSVTPSGRSVTPSTYSIFWWVAKYFYLKG